MPGVGIISNPHAGINKRDPSHNTLVWYVLGNRGQFEVTQSAERLLPICKEFKQRGVDHIGIIGGDGTICLALQEIYKAYGHDALPRILVMRGGTMNVVAANLGIYGKPAFIMNDFLNTYHSKQSYFEVRLTTLNIDGKFGFLFGNGATAKFLVEFYKTQKSPVYAGMFFAKTVLGGLLQGDGSKLFNQISSPAPLEVRFEDGIAGRYSYSHRRVSLSFASTLPKAPLGIHLCKQLTKLENDFAEMIIVTAEGRRLVAEAARVLGGLDTHSEYVHRTLFKNAKIQVEPGSLYTLDGELFKTNSGEIDISMGPTFTFCSPYPIAGAS